MTPDFYVEHLAEELKERSISLIKEYGNLPPTFFGVKDNEIMPPIILPCVTEQEKVYATQAVRHASIVMGMDAVIFVSEVWFKEYDKGDAPKTIIRPSELADRQEGMFMSISAKGGDNCWIADIKRDGDNVDIAEWRKMPGRSEGIFCNMVSKEEPKTDSNGDQPRGKIDE